MVSPFALISLENSAAHILRGSLEPAGHKLAGDVVRAINCKNQDQVIAAINNFDPYPQVKKSIRACEELAVSTAIFGASRVLPPQHSMFTKGEGLHLVMKAAEQLTRVGSEIASTNVRRLATKTLMAKSDQERKYVVKTGLMDFCGCGQTHARTDVLKAGTITLPENAGVDDYADALHAAITTGSRVAAHTAANLTTTRLAAYGFLAQAQKEGIEQYQITSILDERTCPVCMFMNGKIMSVGPTLDQLREALSENDSSRLSEIAPWPGQTKDAVAELFTMDAEELMKRGFMSPPFHPACRCLLTKVGSVEETIRPQTDTQATALVSSASWIDTLLNWVTNGSKGEASDQPPPADFLEPG